jgi:hypothetical protein
MHLGSLGQTGPACRSDLDSHADASVVSAGMAYDAPGSGKVVIMILHQVINLPHFPHNLLNPMKMRLNDVVVN